MGDLSKTRHVLVIVIVAMMLTGELPSGNTPVSAASSALFSETVTDDSSVPGELLLKLKPGMDENDGSRVFREAGVQCRTHKICPGTDDIMVLDLMPGYSTGNTIDRLRTSGIIEYAEPNYIRSILFTPDDPGFSHQWGLENTGQEIEGTTGIPGADINAMTAWDMERGQTNPVTVAVLDSGIAATIPEIDNNVWSNDDEIAGNGLDDDGNGYVDDVSGYNLAGISQRSYTNVNGEENKVMYKEFGASSATRCCAQSIKGTGQKLTHIGVMISSINEPTQGVKVSLRGMLTGPDISAFTIPPGEINAAPTEEYRQLSLPVLLEQGITYYIVVETANENALNHYLLYDYQSALTGWFGYWDGHEHTWNGTSWASNSGDDLYFRTNPNSNPHDDNSHGTQVAGIIAAEHNGQGIAGVSPGARIMPLKVTDSSGKLTSADICEAIYYAVDNGAKVINMSFGGLPYSAAEQDAIDFARARGVLVFAAAGNMGNSTVWYPAGYKNVMGVGATNNKDERAYFSNYNSSVDVTAPGQDVYTTHRSGGYMYASGTSFASPHAAGTAALILSVRPYYPAARVESLMAEHAEDLGVPGRDDTFGFGRLDTGAAVRAALAPVINSIKPEVGPAGTELSVYGDNLGNVQGDSRISIGGRVPDVASWENNRISCIVPRRLTSPTCITISNHYGTCESMRFQVLPTIDRLARAHVDSGNAFFVYGDAFGIEQGNSSVKFGDSVAAVSLWTNERILCQVPEGLTGTVDVRVVTDAGDSLPVPFAVAQPTWYLAEGSSAWGFDTYISVMNPNDTPVTVDINYMLTGEADKSQTIRMPARSRTTLYPGQTLGERDFSTRVSCREGLTIAADRTMEWTGQQATAPESHSSIGVAAPARTWYLPEGSTRWGFETWLLVQNPNSTPADCTVTYMMDDACPMPVIHRVPANSRASFSMEADVGKRDCSIKVDSNIPVIPERAMYRNGRREGHVSIGAIKPAKDFYLAEGSTAWGFTSYILVQNPCNAPNTVKITYMTPRGAVSQAPFTVNPNSRKTIRINDVTDMSNTDCSAHLSGSLPLVAERAMYWGAGTPLGEACHDSVGMPLPATIFYLPDGETSNGIETYTLVQNPNRVPVEVTITYMTLDGKGNVEKTETVPARSRKTFNTAEHSGMNGRISIVVRDMTGSRPIVVERAMYWPGRGAGTVTIGAGPG